jgi:hypothetical protein
MIGKNRLAEEDPEMTPSTRTLEVGGNVCARQLCLEVDQESQAMLLVSIENGETAGALRVWDALYACTYYSVHFSLMKHLLPDIYILYFVITLYIKIEEKWRIYHSVCMEDE